MEDSIIKNMASDIGHCGNIASSALTLATERSMDINVPMILTLMMLKKLCEVNIAKLIEDREYPPEVVKLARLIGKDMRQIEKEAYAAMDEMLDDYFEWSLGKRELSR